MVSVGDVAVGLVMIDVSDDEGPGLGCPAPAQEQPPPAAAAAVIINSSSIKVVERLHSDLVQVQLAVAVTRCFV